MVVLIFISCNGAGIHDSSVAKLEAVLEGGAVGEIRLSGTMVSAEQKEAIKRRCHRIKVKRGCTAAPPLIIAKARAGGGSGGE